MSNDIGELKRQIDIHDLAERLGLERPDPSGNYRSPHHPDRNPSLQIGGRKYPDGWFDHSAERGGDCIDLVQYVLGLDFKEAMGWLRDQYGIAPPPSVKSLDTPRPATLVEHIAANSLKNIAPTVDYLAGRGILPEVIDRAAKLKAIGFNDWTSSKKPPGSVGYGGPATVFLVRSFNPGHLVAVDLRYHDPELSGTKHGSQGEKVGYPWTSDLKRLERSETVVIVESPINALSAESAILAGRLHRWAAIASRGLLVESLDVALYRGKRVLLCLDDNDKPAANGRRPGLEAAWALHSRLTANKVAAHFIDQSQWGEGNDLNELLKAEGAEKTAWALQRLQTWAIPGVAGKEEPGRRRVFLPPGDFGVYYRFRAREDFTTSLSTEKDENGEPRDVTKDLAGFRIAEIAKVNVVSAKSSLTGDIDHQPTAFFAVTGQTSYYGQELIRHVAEYKQLHNVDWWAKFGAVWNKPSFLRLITIWGRATHLNQRDAVNFVGLCWKNGQLQVNEGHDSYFVSPEKQCLYHNLTFPTGTAQAARQVITAYSQTFGHHAALQMLVWGLGGHLKAFLSFWPHAVLQGPKGLGKSTLTERFCQTLAAELLSGQSIETSFRLVTSMSYTTHPICWEEVSARKEEVITRAVSILQESYKFTFTSRGGDGRMTPYLLCAPALIMGESVEDLLKSVISKSIRINLREQGQKLPDDLPAFPVRQWLEYLAKLNRAQVMGLYRKAMELCARWCRSVVNDNSASRMIENYAALLTAWRLLRDFADIPEGTLDLESVLIKTMNEHIADTKASRQPWVWIVEVILHEISAGAYPFPYRFDTTSENEEIFYLRTQQMMHHIRTKPGLRMIWDGLPVKSDRVLKQQLKEAGVIAVDRVGPVIDGKRVDHMVALSIAKLAEYGLHPEVPQKSH